MSLESEIHAEIRRLREHVPGVTGSVVATMDGLLIAQDTTRVEPEAVAALAAANIGLGQRVAANLGHGDLHDTLIRGSTGYVTVHTAGPRALLAVLAAAGANAERVAFEGSLVAQRIAAIVDVLDVTDFVPHARPEPPGTDVPVPAVLPRRLRRVP